MTCGEFRCSKASCRTGSKTWKHCSGKKDVQYHHLEQQFLELFEEGSLTHNAGEAEREGRQQVEA